MKVIAGKWKGRKFSIVTSKKTRPTTSLVRKAYFDSVCLCLKDCSFLDFFSGTGLMGIEALSRGAAEVFFCESDRFLASNISKIIENLKEEEGISFYSQIFTCDWRRTVKVLEKKKKYFSLIYGDPPYSFSTDIFFVSKLAEECLKLLNSEGVLSIELPSKTPWTKEDLFDNLSKVSSLCSYKFHIWEKKYGSARLLFLGV